MSNEIKNILVIKFSSLGDIVHSVPALNEMKKIFPDSRISIAVNSEYADFARCIPSVDEILRFNRIRKSFFSQLKSIKEFINMVRRKNYDIVIDLQGLFRSGLVCGFSGAKSRIGLSNSRECSSIFYNKIVKVSENVQHAVEKYLLVPQEFGATISKPDFSIRISDAIKRSYTKKFDGLDKPIIAISPSARWNSKQWGQNKFVELVNLIQDEVSSSIIFYGAGSEKVFADKIIDQLDVSAINLCGKTNLEELCALLDFVDLVITNDSGPMHIRAALGKPLVGIFGPTNPELTGPYGMNNDVVSINVDCAPCRIRDCSSHKCMNDLPVEKVINKVKEKLNEQKASHI